MVEINALLRRHAVINRIEGSNPSRSAKFTASDEHDIIDLSYLKLVLFYSMKSKYITAYMKVAYTFAELSSAKRLHVGAIVVKDDRIISIGYNGMPAGWENLCEYKLEDGTLKTKPEVLHAESNAIAKLARSSESGLNATLFVTHSPCIECAKLIYQSGISVVYYDQDYRDDAGIKFLQASGVEVNKVTAAVV